jgi:hypothetical protein
VCPALQSSRRPLVYRMDGTEVVEAEKLLMRVGSWSEEDIEDLPELYRRKAREYRRLANRGETEGISDSEE